MLKAYKNNTTGVRGVSFETRASKFRAYITVGGEKIKLGYFQTLESAAQARKNAEQFYKLRFDNQCGNKIVNFVLQVKLKISKENQNYSKLQELGYRGLIQAAKKYDGSSSFFTYAIKQVTDEIKKPKISCITFPNDKMPDLIEEWLNGKTARCIANERDINVRDVMQVIRDYLERVEIKYNETI